MSFLRHDEIYRSDVAFKTMFKFQLHAASRWSALNKPKGRGCYPTPFPSSAMSLGSAIPWRVALQCQAHAMGQNVEGTRRDNEAPGTDGSRPAMQWSSVEPVRPVWPRVAWSEQW